MNTERITRFEVIDHRGDVDLDKKGRVFVSSNVAIDVSLQDQGRTLKVFVGDRNK